MPYGGLYRVIFQLRARHSVAAASVSAAIDFAGTNGNVISEILLPTIGQNGQMMGFEMQTIAATNSLIGLKARNNTAGTATFSMRGIDIIPVSLKIT